MTVVTGTPDEPTAPDGEAATRAGRGGVAAAVGGIFKRLVVAPARLAGTLTRAGLADPLLAAATARSVARWGPSLAAMYHAAALRHPERAAIVDDEGSLTFAQMDAWTDAVAGGLAAEPGGAPRTVGILCRNHRGFLAAAIVAAKCGASTVCLNTGFAAPALAGVVEREGVDLVVHDTEFVPLVGAAAVPRAVLADDTGPPTTGPPTRQPTWRTTGPDATGHDPTGLPTTGHDSTGSFAALAARRRPAPARPRRVGQPVLLTSGTTGTPKGARRGRPRLDPDAATGLLAAIPYRTDDVFVVPAPLFHAWGLSQMLLAGALGATLVTRRRFDPAATLADIATHGGTVLAAVPVMLARILRDVAPADTPPVPTLRVVATSGSALSGSLALEWMDRFGENLYNLYGSTEVGQATVATPVDLRRHPGTAGHVIAGSQVAILDASGAPQPAGRTGRIFVGSPHRFSGYTGGGGKQVIRGLLDTGDVGHLDARGLLYVTGRQDDMIVSGGENVFPREVEDLLADHPAVAEVAVVGVADAELGERLRAVLVRRPGARLTKKQVQDHVRAHLARHKVPRDVVFVDVLPRNAAGKVLRATLRATLHERGA